MTWRASLGGPGPNPLAPTERRPSGRKWVWMTSNSVGLSALESPLNPPSRSPRIHPPSPCRLMLPMVHAPGPDTSCSPRHRMPCNSIHEGSNCGGCTRGPGRKPGASSYTRKRLSPSLSHYAVDEVASVVSLTLPGAEVLAVVRHDLEDPLGGVGAGVLQEPLRRGVAGLEPGAFTRPLLGLT